MAKIANYHVMYEEKGGSSDIYDTSGYQTLDEAIKASKENFEENYGLDSHPVKYHIYKRVEVAEIKAGVEVDRKGVK